MIQVREWSVIMVGKGRGGGVNKTGGGGGGGGGGASEVLSLLKVLAMLKGGHDKF